MRHGPFLSCRTCATIMPTEPSDRTYRCYHDLGYFASDSTEFEMNKLEYFNKFEYSSDSDDEEGYPPVGLVRPVSFFPKLIFFFVCKSCYQHRGYYYGTTIMEKQVKDSEERIIILLKRNTFIKDIIHFSWTNKRIHE